jgi:raffinose/stachyose/melibiose transport system permease protein
VDEGEQAGRDRPVPRLGDADDVRHDHGGDPGAHRRQDVAVVVREDGSVRLLEVPQELSLTEQNTEPASAALALRKPVRLRQRDQGERVEPPGAPRRIAYLYLLPALAVYAAFVLAPLGHTIWLSLHAWDGLTPATWVGLDNYSEILHDSELRSAFEHSFVLIFFYAVIPVTLALVLVGALSRARVRGQAGFRTVLFLPQVIPLVVVAVIWRMIYAPDGSLNRALDAIGLGSLARPWLGDFTWALPSIGFVGTWVMSGLALVLFMAGVQKIPQSLYDAARVDGAGPLREFFAVTLPNLRGEIAVALTLTTIAALRNFDLVYITTQGGPGNATSVPSFQVYNRAFQIGEIGSACAVGFTLACVIFVLAFAITRVADRGQT